MRNYRTINKQNNNIAWGGGISQAVSPFAISDNAKIIFAIPGSVTQFVINEPITINIVDSANII